MLFRKKNLQDHIHYLPLVFDFADDTGYNFVDWVGAFPLTIWSSSIDWVGGLSLNVWSSTSFAVCTTTQRIIKWFTIRKNEVSITICSSQMSPRIQGIKPYIQLRKNLTTKIFIELQFKMPTKKKEYWERKSHLV